MSSKVPRILVVGGGAGGIELVTALGKKLGKKGLAKIYLSDRKPTHIWKPLLHEVATGSLNVGEDEVNYFVHASNNGYRFHYGSMIGIDRNRKYIKTDTIKDLDGNKIWGPREFRYDTLVMAIGARTNSFGIPGVDKHCLTLDSLREAERLRRAFQGYGLNLAFKNIDKLKIGIVGAGPTGVELAAEINRVLKEVNSYGIEIKREALEVTLLEAGPGILPGAAPHISKFALKELTKHGIKILTNCMIVGVEEKGFRLKDGSLVEIDCKIWTAGIKAAEWLKDTGLQLDGINRIKVDSYLQSIDDPSIFAMGDCANCPDPRDPTGKTVCPATAQCAHQQADWLAVKLRNDILKKKTKEPFMFHTQGMLVSLGHTTAVGTVTSMKCKSSYKVRGKMAKWVYSSLYRMHQAAMYGKLRAFGIWVGDKLRGMTLPQVKLH